MARAVSRASLGTLSQLPDEILDEILSRLNDARALGMCAQTCAAMRVLCYEEPLWKAIALNAYRGGESATEKKEQEASVADASFRYVHSWRCTSLMLILGIEAAQALQLVGERTSLGQIESPFLYARWYRCNVSLSGFSGETASVPRIRNVSPDYFTTTFVSCSSPAMICDLQESWAAMRLWRDRETFIERCGDAELFCNTVNSVGARIRMKMRDFLHYMDQQRDESPLYIFDSAFGESVPVLLEDYAVPDFFPDDFFSVLGDAERPHYRWLTIGPSRSGASWHVDPFLTSAWNSLIVGEKRWALYPPGRTPPGLEVEMEGEDADDGSGEPQVLSEITSLQWYLEVYPHLKPEEKPMEITQQPGETIFIPSGWWHCVLNLQHSVAVTQNFVDRFNFRTVARELIPGNESPSPWLEKDNSRVRRYRRLNRFRHWLRLLLAQNYSCLTNQIMEVGDQTFNLKQLISTLETICNRHKLAMPTNEGLFPLRGGSEPVFDTGEKIIKLLSVNRTGCQEASILKHIQSLPGSYQLLKQSVPIVDYFSEDYCVLTKCKGQSLRELWQAGEGVQGHLNQVFLKLGRVIAQLHAMTMTMGNSYAQPTSPSFSGKLHRGRHVLTNEVARQQRFLHRNLWSSLNEYLVNGDELFQKRYTSNLNLGEEEQQQEEEAKRSLSCSYCRQAVIHGDLTEDNILYDIQSSHVYLIDFGDTAFGDPLYDLIGIYLSSCHGNADYMNTFLRSYCEELKRRRQQRPDVEEARKQEDWHSTGVGDMYGLSASEIKRLALYYVLVHEENALEAAVSYIPRALACSSFQELEEALFGRLYM